MKKIRKQALAVFLAAVLLVGAAPAAGFADWLTVTASAEIVQGRGGEWFDR